MRCYRAIDGALMEEEELTGGSGVSAGGGRECGPGLVCPRVRLGGLDPGLGWPS